jgi:hypothetical protein
MAFSKASRYCLAHAQCPVVAISPPALVSELGHGRLAWAFWRRSLTPEQVLRDRDRPARGLLRRHVAPYLGSVPLGKIDTPMIRAWRARLLDQGISVSETAKAYASCGRS